jgi:hypothetical protein
MGLQSIIQRWKNQVPSNNKTDHNDITEIYLQVVLNTINQNPSTLYISVIKQQLYTKPSKLHLMLWWFSADPSYIINGQDVYMSRLDGLVQTHLIS